MAAIVGACVAATAPLHGCRGLLGYQDIPLQAGTPVTDHMLIGLSDFDDTRLTWMQSSGAKWDVRWNYFVASAPGVGWYNGYNQPPGAAYAMNFLQDSVAAGVTPCVLYQLIAGDYAPTSSPDTPDPAAFATKLQTKSVTSDYFAKVKQLFAAAKLVAPAKVFVVVEPYDMGNIELGAQNDPSTMAVIGSSGLPELAGLPDSIAGFGLAFLALRQAVGATNVVLGIGVQNDVNGDFINANVQDALGAHVDYQYGGFYRQLGLAPNQTGATYDFVADHPADGDVDWYVSQNDYSRLWDPSDNAPVDTRSFNRYAEWLAEFYAASGVPWVLWRLPLGNSNSPDVANSVGPGAWVGPYPPSCVVPPGCSAQARTGCPGGYKDNRPEYFFGDGGTAHMQKFAQAGVIGLFFGPSADGTSDYVNDYYPDGQLFMKSRAGAFLRAGGLPLPH
jgi:hypothetical protein